MPAFSPLTNAKVDRAAPGRAVRGRGTKHRLMVLTGDTPDTIVSAGGLIFDRAAAGWDVDVYGPHAVDDRAFRILGVRTPVLQCDIDWTNDTDCVVVAGSLYEKDRTTRRLFQKAATMDGTEAALWGADWPSELGPGMGVVEHRLSLAALAFKSEAMKAVGLSAPCAQTEAFHSGRYRAEIAAPLLAPA